MSATEWYQSAIFANLSYVRWTADNTFVNQGIVDAAADSKRLPRAVGELLFKGDDAWTIPSYYPNDDSGFAANVFQNDTETVLAIRGTEANLIEALPFVGDTGLQDLFRADLVDIGIVGFALEQTVSLANYVMRLQASLTDPQVTQVVLHSKVLPAVMDPDLPVPFIRITSNAGPLAADTYFWLEEAAPVVGLGVIDVDGHNTVTGHSLGGHLATMAIRLFPGLFSEAVTFNAPGFDPLSSLGLTDQFVSLLGGALGITPAASFGDIAFHITAIESESSAPGDDPSLVASLLTGIPVGTEVLVHTENNSHSMDQLMDDLAVQSVVSSMNPGLGLVQLQQSYDGIGIDPGATNETLLQSLAGVILGVQPDLDRVAAGPISHGDFAARTAMHELIIDLSNAIAGQGLTLVPLWDKTAVELADLARESLFYRMALANLDPFVILGNEDLYLRQADALPFMADMHTGEYWLARAEMMLGLFEIGLADGAATGSGEREITYTDLETDVAVSRWVDDQGVVMEVTFAGEAGTGANSVLGSGSDDALFGGSGVDWLAGGAGSDYLEGSAGADVLTGGTTTWASDDGVADLLHGGSGADLYYVGNLDVIVDTDRTVADILLAGYSLSMPYEHIGDGVFRSSDELRTLEIVGNDAHISLTGLAAPVSILIRDFLPADAVFLDGDFGIDLVSPDSTEGYDGGFDIVGTTQDDVTWGESGDEWALIGSAANESIGGLEGDDYIESGWGVDFVDAGPGNDVVSNVPIPQGIADWEGDFFLGGTGNDFLSGNGGDDSLSGGEGDDFLQGASGDDLIRGDMGDDLVFGGYGSDRVYGGAGDDYILADMPFREVSPWDWVVSAGNMAVRDILRQEAPAVPGNQGASGDDEVWGGAGHDQIDGEGGNDILHGDSGNDRLTGGYGDDHLDGGAGGDSLRGGYGEDVLDGGSHDDILSGEEGDDILYGGAGDDRLFGNAGSDILVGGAGSDRYGFEEGGGWDRIQEQPGAQFDRNSILLPPGHAPWGYDVSRSEDDLVIAYLGDDAGIIVSNWFDDPDSILDEVHFGSVTWNIEDLQALAAGQGTRWSDVLYGGEEDNWFVAGGGDDYGVGGGGDDVMYGNSGFDNLVGGDGNDFIDGGSEGDYLEGNAGDDVLVAGESGVPGQIDSMSGGEGSDRYVVSPAAGAIAYVLDSGTADEDWDVIVMPDGLSPNDMAVRRVVLHGTVTTALEVLYPGTGAGDMGSVTIFNWFNSGAGRIEALLFGDGVILGADEIDARIGTATPAPDFLEGFGDVATLLGLGGDDRLEGRATHNTLRGEEGDDILLGTGGENLLVGGHGADHLEAISTRGDVDSRVPGTTVLFGGEGTDSLVYTSAGEDLADVALLDGGDQGDAFTVNGSGTVILAGGDGFDYIELGTASANVVVLINMGEMGDVVVSADDWGRDGVTPAGSAQSNAISFGGGTVPGDVTLTQDSRDLLVRIGATEGVRLAGYFDELGQPADWLGILQFVQQATADFAPGSADPQQHSPILMLDFGDVVDAYLATRGQVDAPWSLLESDWQRHAQFVQAEAIGGQVAYEYALAGSGLHDRNDAGITDLLRQLSPSGTPSPVDLLSTLPVNGAIIAPLAAVEGAEFHFEIPENWIVDPLSGQSLAPVPPTGLPSWLAYDTGSRTLSGTPGMADAGTATLTFSAINGFGQSAEFAIQIETQDGDAGDGVVITGDTGNDNLVGTPGTDTISGGTGSDFISGGEGSDLLAGGSGRDTVWGGAGDDVISGGQGADLLLGEEGADSISGGPGYDRIFGGSGDDVLSGDQGRNFIAGGDGNDRLISIGGGDRLDGGIGDDTFVIATLNGKVRIQDALGIDTLDLEAIAATDDIRFTRRGDNLLMSIADTKGQITITDWFSEPEGRVERFKFSDDVILLEQDVLNLIQHRVSMVHMSGSDTGFAGMSSGLIGIDPGFLSPVWEPDTGVAGTGLHR